MFQTKEKMRVFEWYSRHQGKSEWQSLKAETLQVAQAHAVSLCHSFTMLSSDYPFSFWQFLSSFLKVWNKLSALKWYSRGVVMSLSVHLGRSATFFSTSWWIFHVGGWRIKKQPIIFSQWFCSCLYPWRPYRSSLLKATETTQVEDRRHKKLRRSW